MGTPVKRRKKFGKSPTFTFSTKALRGIKPDTPEERNQKEIAKKKWFDAQKPIDK